MNSKRCNRCGMVNTMDAQYCSNCGEYLNSSMNNSVNNSMNNSVNNDADMDKKKADNMAAISALLFYLGAGVVAIISKVIPVIGDLLYNMRGLCSIAGIVIMIVGRVKYPDNKALKIVMWAIIVTIAVLVILVILYFVTAADINNRVSTSNYGLVLPYRFW